jgi:orotidine-5'-phosphate decarboxylase
VASLHPPPSSTVGFGDRIAAAVAERESQLVLGLDPDPDALWPSEHEPRGDTPAQRAADAVLEHCFALIEAVGPACVAIKPQLARFEALGSAGWSALDKTIGYAHDQGLLVIADGKRGDIDVSAQAYAHALTRGIETPWGSADGLRADAMTVNPLMGRDAVEPFVSVARERGGGVLMLVRTSNPGAADVEDLRLADGGTVWERLAALAGELGRDGVATSGLSDVGAVVGATAPEHLERARELMPHAVLLLPGIGAQGGRVEDLAAAFAPGRGGGLIAASRSIAGAHLASGGDPAEAARAEAERLRELAWGISG